jgi:hypothetical protein
MKRIASLLVLITTVFCASASTNVINLNYTFNLSVLEQNTNHLAPLKYKFDNKTLLSTLATAENHAGNYPTNIFPTGSKIAWQYDYDLAYGRFVVLNTTNSLVCDVSDIFTAELADNPELSYASSGKSGYYNLSNVTLDTTAIGGTLKLHFYGVVNEIVTGTTSSSGITTETHQFKYSGVAGNGMDPAGGLVVTGTLSASGKRTY